MNTSWFLPFWYKGQTQNDWMLWLSKDGSCWAVADRIVWEFESAE